MRRRQRLTAVQWIEVAGGLLALTFGPGILWFGSGQLIRLAIALVH